MEAQMAMGAAHDAARRTQFQQLIDAHRKIVFKVANTYARTPEDRADLAQEIVAQGWRAFARYEDARAFSTWLYRIALNVAISHLRSAELRNRHAVALDEDLHDVADERSGDAEQDERMRLLRRFIDALDPLNRALLLLYLEDKSYREIADVLGISETNVATKISRLKQRIRTDMGDGATNR
ncbi:MAG: sigma-70 family RNA polymerase sigma factor [Rudaea sp.]|nr:sigma-70 family RNA polymerase sigma factor [Rudaea sp.]MBR0345718.1 sigma-70 family RNA polymerase sigma factor [Rudaea sp.]